MRAQTNRETATRARVRWWRTLEYSILVVTMDQSDDDRHTFQIAVRVIQTCLMKFIVRTYLRWADGTSAQLVSATSYRRRTDVITATGVKLIIRAFSEGIIIQETMSHVACSGTECECSNSSCSLHVCHCTWNPQASDKRTQNARYPYAP